MKKGIGLLVGCSMVVAAGLFAQQQAEQSPSPVKGPKHDVNKPAATNDSQTGGPAGTNKNHKEQATGQEQSSTESKKTHKHHKAKSESERSSTGATKAKSETEKSSTGATNANGRENVPDASMSAVPNPPARTGGAEVPRPGLTPEGTPNQSAGTNNGPNASMSAVPNPPARTGGAEVPRPSLTPEGTPSP